MSTEKPSEHDVRVLLTMYQMLGDEIAQHEVHIHGIRHKQTLIIGLMRESGLTYREIAALLPISKSRVHQLAESTPLGRS